LPKKSKVRPVEHFAALPYIEIGAFVAELRQQDSIAARTLEFAILTAARPGEAIGARWDEINIGERLWTIPAARTKSGREHRVPLSDAAIVVIEQMAAIRHSEHVFPGRLSGRAIGDTTIFDLLRGMGRDITAHGFRSSFRDWAGEQTNFAREVAEMALAHAVGDAVERAYRRGDLFQKRRQLMDAWARYCAMPKARCDILPLHAG
jgi:integrase